MGFLRRLWYSIKPNPLDQKIDKWSQAHLFSILIIWNRGLGDIPIALYAVIWRIRQKIPDAKITFLTRPDLWEGFLLLEKVSVIVDPAMKRGEPFSYEPYKKIADAILDEVDVDRHLCWQEGFLKPSLQWNEKWDHLKDRFNLEGEYVAIHAHSETDQFYGRSKNLQTERIQSLISQISSHYGKKIILFGHQKNFHAPSDQVVDLRGQTGLLELLCIVQHHCRYMIAPDSGILCITYYLNRAFPIRIVSLWGNPYAGVLRVKAPSPNPLLEHKPLFGRKKEVSQITNRQIEEALFV